MKVIKIFIIILIVTIITGLLVFLLGVWQPATQLAVNTTTYKETIYPPDPVCSGYNCVDATIPEGRLKFVDEYLNVH